MRRRYRFRLVISLVEILGPGAAAFGQSASDYIAQVGGRSGGVLQSGKHQLRFEASLADGPRLRADSGLVFLNRVRPGSPMRSLAFNTARFPFDDVRIRRAAAIAINREEVTRELGSGELIPKADYLGTNTPG